MTTRILIVDDEPMVFAALRRMLHTMAYAWDIAFAENGRQALRLLAQYHFDLVVTDILMPEMDGLETIMAVRDGYPEVKIIAISGGHRQHNLDYLHIAKQLGATRTLSKPFDGRELMGAIREVLHSDDRPSQHTRSMSR